MKIGIMQPYFFPYIGYWQLINEVDKFVIYDNIQFTKKGWIRRNRILCNGKDKMISLPIKKDSDFLDVKERFLPDDFDKSKSKILNQIKTAYKKAPEFQNVFPIIEKVMNCKEENLFFFIFETVKVVAEYLDIDTEIIVSSELNVDDDLKGKNRVIQTCKVMEGDEYINPIGGLELYDKEEFELNGIDLKFIRTEKVIYKQFENEFVPSLSIIDVLMFNSVEEVKEMLQQFTLC